MKKLKALVALAVLLGFVGLWTAFAQSAAPSLTLVDKVGWWTRRPAALPTENPANFEVAEGVQGDESIAALRVLIRGDITRATLVLGEADAPFKDLEEGKLRVCTTAEPWIVVDGGKWDDAPTPDCGAAVELTRTADPAGNGSWAGDVTNYLAGARSEVTLMVLPSPDAAVPLPTTYWIKFLARVDAEGTPDLQPPAVPTVPTAPLANVPPAPALTTPAGTVTPATTAAPPTTVAAAAPPVAEPPKRFAVATPRKTPPKPWGKLFILVPLSAIGAALFTGGHKFWAQRLEAATT